uniref:XK-related protein n=1 Tax=Ditylenchus dipsaci TaxID=166011 RepID=A0A915CQ18_9BILA
MVILSAMTFWHVELYYSIDFEGRENKAFDIVYLGAAYFLYLSAIVFFAWFLLFLRNLQKTGLDCYQVAESKADIRLAAGAAIAMCLEWTSRTVLYCIDMESLTIWNLALAIYPICIQLYVILQVFCVKWAVGISSEDLYQNRSLLFFAVAVSFFASWCGLGMFSAGGKKNSRVKRQYLKTDMNSAANPVNPGQTNVYLEHGANSHAQVHGA